MSTLNVEAISHPTPGSNVTINGTTPAGTNQLGNRNLIINGAMQVAQRGTSSGTGGFGTVDRFNNGYNSGTVTQSQESLSSGSPYDEGFRNFLRFSNTTPSSDNAAGYRMARYNIEAQDLASSGWNYTSSSSYLTLSFWIRASVSQAYYVYIKTHDGTAQRYVFSTGTLTADTWTKVTHQIPGNSNLTINNDNGAGLELNFSAFWGTDNTDSGVTVDTWGTYSGNTRTPDMTTTWSTTASATFDITGVQLEVGEVATPFEHRSYGDELARCERYYQVIKGGAGAFTSNAAFIAMNFSPMRATPTFTADGVLRFTDVIQADYTQSSAQLVVGNATDRNGVTDAQNLSTTSGRVAIFIPNNGNYINASAEL
jgi:hypothetical protein